MPPLHPLLVHFPIALLPVAFLLEVAAIYFKRRELSQGGWWIQVFGTAGLLAATLSGLIAHSAVQTSDHATLAALDNHQQLAFVADAVFALLLLWRIGARSLIPEGRRGLYLSIYALGVLLLIAAGLFGGIVVYEFGVGVSAR